MYARSTTQVKILMTHNRSRFPFSHDTQFVYLIRFILSFFFMFVIICDCFRKPINKVINIPINKFDTSLLF